MAFGKKKQPDAAQTESGKTVQGLGDLPPIDDPGPRPNSFFKLLKWRRKVRKERRKLRKALKLKGITSRDDFEHIAWSMGLVLDRGNAYLFFAWWRWALSWFKTAKGLATLVGAALALLGSLFLVSYLSDLAGSFTINLTSDLTRQGFVLSESQAFDRVSSRLISEKVKHVTNITMDDLPGSVDLYDGPHNGDHYLAYSFYIRNEGENAADYTYKLLLKSSSLNVDEAAWILLFEDGRQILYAKPSADGDDERLFGYTELPPFLDTAYYPNIQYYQRDGSYGIRATSFLDEQTVCAGYVRNVEPGEYHRYTVVIWVEGYDPECTNDIFGGFAKYSMEFNVVTAEDRQSIFRGVWRTEYDDYVNGVYYEGAQRVTPETVPDEEQIPERHYGAIIGE